MQVDHIPGRGQGPLTVGGHNQLDRTRLTNLLLVQGCKTRGTQKIGLNSFTTCSVEVIFYPIC